MREDTACASELEVVAMPASPDDDMALGKADADLLHVDVSGREHDIPLVVCCRTKPISTDTSQRQREVTHSWSLGTTHPRRCSADCLSSRSL